MRPPSTETQIGALIRLRRWQGGRGVHWAHLCRVNTRDALIRRRLVRRVGDRIRLEPAGRQWLSGYLYGRHGMISEGGWQS